jgi:cathepsin D
MPSDSSYSKILRGLLNYERNTGKRHPLSLGVRDFKRAIVSNPLTDVDGQIWFGTVYVGTPSVAFTINFDTGSSDFVIPGLACDWQGTKYNPAASATSVALGQNFEVEFGDGSEASGSLYNDTVTIVGLAATRQTFGSASIFGRDFRDTEDGIMGMAFRSLSEYNANPVFQNLVDQGQTTLPYFAMKLTAGNSELDIGGLVSVLYTGPITWVPVLNQEYWEVRFDSLKIGGEVLVAASPCIIDSVCSNYSLLTLLDRHFPIGN